VRYNRTLNVDSLIYNNLNEFMLNKQPFDQLFDKVNSNDINKYLQNFMKNLTAKVFRTYNASALFQKELKKVNKKFEDYDGDDKINLLLDEFNKANAKVAMLCNHQKNITKSTNKQIDNINNSIKKVKAAIRKAKKSPFKNQEKITLLQNKLIKFKSKKELKIELKNISLGTSKVNYIDPRITVAFLKKYSIPIEKIFTKTLQEKFKWAIDIDIDYKF